MNYKRLLFLWLLMVMFSGGARAQTYTDHIVRSYKISAKSSVEVYNKYGKVHVRPHALPARRLDPLAMAAGEK